MVRSRYIFGHRIAPAWLLAVMLCPMISQAQDKQMTGWNIADHLLIREAVKAVYGNETQVIGSRYLNEEFEKGTVYSWRGAFEDLPLRWDIYDNWVEFQQKGSTYILDPAPVIQKITLGEQTLVVENIAKGRTVTPTFLVLLDSGKASLLARKIIFFTPAKAAGALESSNTPAKFTHQDDRYFLKAGEKTPVEVSNLKQIVDNLPDKSKELSDFIKKEGLSSRSADDMVRLVRFYNTL